MNVFTEQASRIILTAMQQAETSCKTIMQSDSSKDRLDEYFYKYYVPAITSLADVLARISN